MSDCSAVTIPIDVVKYYKYNVPGHEEWMRDCVMSPKSCYCAKRKGFIVCKKCYTALNKSSYPHLGIKNGYMIGTAPDIVDALSPEEISCISLVRNTAHIFTYMGGEEKNMKGWHSMLEVDLSQVERTLRGMTHSDLGFPDSIVVILEGPMTRAQYRRAKNKSNASRKNMMKVLEWYIRNNYLYAEHFKAIPNMDDIPTPQLIERVKIVESADTNIELTEEMSMVFPDDSLDETTGGFGSIEEFKEMISEINKGNVVAKVTSRASQYVYGNNEANFAKAFPVQYPYGIGGPNQMRTNGSDDMTKTDFVKYIQHVNNLSNLNFHTQLFTVFSWNVLEKKTW